MAKEPEARYASAAALAEDLRRFLDDEPVLARPIGLVARLARWCRRQPRLATAVGLAAASLVLATGLSIALAWSQFRAASQASHGAGADARRRRPGPRRTSATPSKRSRITS